MKINRILCRRGRQSLTWLADNVLDQHNYADRYLCEHESESGPIHGGAQLCVRNLDRSQVSPVAG